MSELIANLIARNKALEKRLNYLETQENNSSGDTAADILTKLLTVDGSGSGLDADLLDGYHASSFGLLGATNTWTQPNVFTVGGGNVRLSSSYYGPDLYVNTSGEWARQYTLRNDYAGATMRFGVGAYGDSSGAVRGYMVFKDGDENLYTSTLGIQVTSSGNVGIGTTSPSYPLHVNGSMVIDGTSVLYMKKNTSSTLATVLAVSGILPDATVLQSAGGGVTLRKADGTSVLTATEGGDVGIGTTSPDTKLVVDNGTTSVVPVRIDIGYTYSTAHFGGIDLYRSGNNAAGEGISLLFSNKDSAGNKTEYAIISGQVDDNTNGSEDGKLAFALTKAGATRQTAMTLTNTGLGIGTTSPGKLLHLSGSSWTGLRLQASGSNYWDIESAHSATNADLRFTMNGTEMARFNASGQLGIGTTPAAGYYLDVNGQTRVRGAAFYHSNANPVYYVDGGVGLKFLDSGGGNNLKVGIGTTPQRQLHVYGAGSVLAIDAPAASDSDIDFFSAGAVKSSIYRPASSNDLRVWTNSVGDIMTFGYSSGNVGIGTTNPQGRIHAYNGYGGFMFVSRTGVSTVAQTIIQNGTGDVTRAVLVVGYVRSSGGTSTNLNIRVDNGGTFLAGSFGMDVASDGTFTIYSTSGSTTYDFHAICIWS